MNIKNPPYTKRFVMLLTCISFMVLGVLFSFLYFTAYDRTIDNLKNQAINESELIFLIDNLSNSEYQKKISELSYKKRNIYFKCISEDSLDKKNEFEIAAFETIKKGFPYYFKIKTIDNIPYFLFAKKQENTEHLKTSILIITIPAQKNLNTMKEERSVIFFGGLVVSVLFFGTILLSLRRFIEQIHITHQNLINLASNDGLTGLLNKKTVIDRFFEEFSRHKRHHEQLSCLLIDIDHFKNINDTYGHQAGDFILQYFSSILKNTTRKYDIVGRYGGEEFIVVLPKTNLKHAVIVAEKIRNAIVLEKIESDKIKTALTVSIGISTMLNEEEETIDTMIKRADIALYKAKKAGRNQSVID